MRGSLIETVGFFLPPFKIYWESFASGVTMGAPIRLALSKQANCKFQTKFKKQPTEGTIDTLKKGIALDKFPIYCYGLQLQSAPHRVAKTPVESLQAFGLRNKMTKFWAAIATKYKLNPNLWFKNAWGRIQAAQLKIELN